MGYKFAAAFTPSEIASGTPPTTMIQILAATHIPVYVYEIHIGLDTTVECEFSIEKQTTAGTMSSGTLTKLGSYSETLQTSYTYNATAEPTSGSIIMTVKGNRGADIVFPSDKPLIVAGGERLGIVIEAADSAVNASCWVRFEE